MQTPNRSNTSLLISLILLLGVVLLLVTAMAMAFSAIFPYIIGENIDTSGMILGAAFGVEAIILAFATYFCFQKYLGRSASDEQTQIRVSAALMIFLIFVAGIPILIGYLIRELESVKWIALPILTIPAVILPLYLLLVLATREIELGPRWRAWAIFGLGMTVGPFTLFVIEAIILLFLLIGVVFFLVSQPQLVADMQVLAEQFQRVGDHPEALLPLVAPYAAKPAVLTIVLLFFAVIIPVVEEPIKPLGVWLFARRLDSPAQGFALGR